MLWIVTGILTLLWLLGMIVSFTLSGYIHLLLLIALILLLVTILVLIQIIKRKERN